MSKENNSNKDDELLSVKSGFSKMSGASNFDHIDKLTMKKKF